MAYTAATTSGTKDYYFLLIHAWHVIVVLHKVTPPAINLQVPMYKYTAVERGIDRVECVAQENITELDLSIQCAGSLAIRPPCNLHVIYQYRQSVYIIHFLGNCFVLGFI